MSKSHIINLTITNNTPFDFNYNDDWFDSGRLADGNSWPQTINAGTTAQIECYEKDWAIGVGCSGWVKYITQGKELFFCFSNPSVGSNGINIGLTDEAWNAMSGKYSNGITLPLPINGTNLWLTGHISSTGGDDNEARWDVRQVDLNEPLLENIQMDDVLTSFNNISSDGNRQYYACLESPTSITGLAKSHFKGISLFAEKLIFSHTNLDVTTTHNGKYIVADKITISDQGYTELTAETGHLDWLHPCASQACGSFMALGIQESADNPSNTSEIEIYDIRSAAINQPINLLGSIQRSDNGVNGVAMTRELNGNYLVGSVNGNRLTVYRSSTTDLLSSFPDFNIIIDQTDFPESGAGLALITQKNGDIYLIALNAEDNGDNNHMALFQLDFVNNKAIPIGNSKPMPIPGLTDTVTLLEEYAAAIVVAFPPIGIALEALLSTYGAQYLNTSFRWGKGVAIRDSLNLDIYATDRNVIPLSSIPLVGSDKDFSVVKWQSN